MSKYGVNRYGSGFTYGETTATSVYYNSGLTATTSDYNTVSLTWSTFTTDPSDNPPNSSWYWKLIKSYTGVPDNPYDGITVTGGQYAGSGANFLTSWVDVDTTVVGVQVSYSLWVFTGSRWVFCGADYGYLVEDQGTLDVISGWMPKAWMNSSGTSGDALGQNDSVNSLVLSLDAFAFMYDHFRLEGNLLAKSSNHNFAPVQVLQSQLSNFGFSLEPSLGDTYHRSLAAAGNLIMEYKGTPLGISTYTTALTHLSNIVTTGHNLMLDYNDSSFEQSVGRWGVSTGTLTNVLYASSSVVAPTNFLHDLTNLPATKGFGQLTTTATTPVTLSLPSAAAMSSTPGGITCYGVPVRPNTRYVFSGWVNHLDNAATLSVNITWYNVYGVSLGTTGAGNIYTTTTSWQEFTSKNTSGRNGQLSPATAAYAAIAISLTPSSAASSRYNFDYLQFAEYTKSFTFQDARRIRVAVRGEKENYVPNPDFEYGLGSWFGYNGTLSLDTLYTVHGTSSAKLSVTGTTAAFVSDWIPVNAGKVYTASAYVTGSSAKPVSIRVEYSSQVQTQVLNDTNGQYYSTDTNMYSSSGVSAAVTNITGTGSLVTYTADNTFQVGQSVSITGVSPASYNLSGVTIASVTSISFTVANGTTDTYISGGIAITNPTTLSTSSPTQVSVTSTAPPTGVDTSLPMAKIHVYFPTAASGDFFWLDGVLLEQSPKASPYFSGSGGVYPSNPITLPFYSVNNCTWETRERFNYISNPSFESNTSDWVPISATVATDNSVAYTGAKSAKLSFASGASGDATGTAFLPYPAIGGEDVTFSAFVYGFTGTVIATASGGTSSISITNPAVWTRVAATGQLPAGATTCAVGVSVVGVAGQTSINIDAAQLEYGRIASTYIDLSDVNTVTIPNPITGSKTIYASLLQPVSGGIGSFINNYGAKVTRLSANLPTVLPNGSSYAVHTGVPSLGYTELVGSLIPSASFEKDMGQWVAVGSGTTLKRTVANGLLFNDSVTHGQAYCQVNNVGTNTTFGIKTSNVPIVANGGYYASAAIRPGVNTVSGTYTLSVAFYNASNTLLYTGSTTKTFSQTGRWNYISGTYPINSINGATYAIVTVSYTSGTGNTNQYFQVDRVVLRQ